MKKILFFALAAFSVVSCFKDTGYEASYTLYATFDGAEDLIEKYSVFADTTATVTTFNYGPVAFFNAIEWDGDAGSETVVEPAVDGGWTLSRKRLPAVLYDAGERLEIEGALTPYSAADTTAQEPNVVNTYLVYHHGPEMPEHDVEFLQASYGTCTAAYVALTNTTAVARYFLDEAAEGDYFKVKVRGYLNGNETGSKEFVLAEKTAAKDSIMMTWQLQDISSIGSVQYVDFEIDANMTNAADEDLNYFCLDNFVASIHIKQ